MPPPRALAFRNGRGSLHNACCGASPPFGTHSSMSPRVTRELMLERTIQFSRSEEALLASSRGGHSSSGPDNVKKFVVFLSEPEGTGNGRAGVPRFAVYRQWLATWAPLHGTVVFLGPAGRLRRRAAESSPVAPPVNCFF
jgi:hypothetical protein